MLKVSSMKYYKTGCALLLTMWVTGCGDAISIPPAQADASTIEQQAQSFVEAMKPRRAGKPIVAVLAVNEGTEMTDFLLPHAVLQRSGVVDVHAVAPQRGRVHLYPALDVEVTEDLASFDQEIGRASCRARGESRGGSGPSKRAGTRHS